MNPVPSRSTGSLVLSVLLWLALAAAALSLVGILTATIYAPLHSGLLDDCIHRAGAPTSDGVTVIDSGSDVVSLWPLGLNCEFHDQAGRQLLPNLPPTDWNPTLQAGAAILAVVLLAAVLAGRRLTASRPARVAAGQQSR